MDRETRAQERTCSLRTNRRTCAPFSGVWWRTRTAFRNQRIRLYAQSLQPMLSVFSFSLPYSLLSLSITSSKLIPNRRSNASLPCSTVSSPKFCTCRQIHSGTARRSSFGAPGQRLTWCAVTQHPRHFGSCVGTMDGSVCSHSMYCPSMPRPFRGRVRGRIQLIPQAAPTLPGHPPPKFTRLEPGRLAEPRMPYTRSSFRAQKVFVQSVSCVVYPPSSFPY